MLKIIYEDQTTLNVPDVSNMNINVNANQEDRVTYSMSLTNNLVDGEAAMGKVIKNDAKIIEVKWFQGDKEVFAMAGDIRSNWNLYLNDGNAQETLNFAIN